MLTITPRRSSKLRLCILMFITVSSPLKKKIGKTPRKSVEITRFLRPLASLGVEAPGGWREIPALALAETTNRAGILTRPAENTTKLGDSQHLLVPATCPKAPRPTAGYIRDKLGQRSGGGGRVVKTPKRTQNYLYCFYKIIYHYLRLLLPSEKMLLYYYDGVVGLGVGVGAESDLTSMTSLPSSTSTSTVSMGSPVPTPPMPASESCRRLLNPWLIQPANMVHKGKDHGSRHTCT
ncbi:unnamed protein product, partial [Trichogramma brassicae]